MTSKSNISKDLEENMVKYSDLVSVDTWESGELFTTLPSSGESVIGLYNKLIDMKDLFPLIPVRKNVKSMLTKADALVKKIDPEYQLVVSYGFRSIEVQRAYFEQEKKRVNSLQLVYGIELNEIVHRSIAVPEVAGHPTGGAIDIYIQKGNRALDFGTDIYDFATKDLYVFSPYINDVAKENRMLLRTVLIEVGFAPFDGEWWHFSYGDKEWAFYYSKPSAIYSQKSMREVQEMLNYKK